MNATPPATAPDPAAAVPAGAAPFRRFGILGPGLIGGSLLLALRALRPGAEIVAGAPSARTRALVEASGAADRVFDPAAEDPATAFDGCDLVFLAAPPRAVVRDLPRFRGARIGLLVDVASVKGAVMAAARGLGNFVGGHPMAGTEGVGFAAADPGLFRGAAFVYCVPEDYAAGADRLAALLALLAELGFRCFAMGAEEHDRRLAIVSHLPHAAAFALAGVAAAAGDPMLARLVGGGFRDTTRIAASAPALWTEILRGSPALPAALDAYIAALSRLRAALDPAAPPEALRAQLEAAEAYRRAIPDGLHAVPHA